MNRRGLLETAAIIFTIVAAVWAFRGDVAADRAESEARLRGEISANSSQLRGEFRAGESELRELLFLHIERHHQTGGGGQ